MVLELRALRSAAAAERVCLRRSAEGMPAGVMIPRERHVLGLMAAAGAASDDIAWLEPS